MGARADGIADTGEDEDADETVDVSADVAEGAGAAEAEDAVSDGPLSIPSGGYVLEPAPFRLTVPVGILLSDIVCYDVPQNEKNVSDAYPTRVITGGRIAASAVVCGRQRRSAAV